MDTGELPSEETEANQDEFGSVRASSQNTTRDQTVTLAVPSDMIALLEDLKKETGASTYGGAIQAALWVLRGGKLSDMPRPPPQPKEEEEEEEEEEEDEDQGVFGEPESTPARKVRTLDRLTRPRPRRWRGLAGR